MLKGLVMITAIALAPSHFCTPARAQEDMGGAADGYAEAPIPPGASDATRDARREKCTADARASAVAQIDAQCARQNPTWVHAEPVSHMCDARIDDGRYHCHCSSMSMCRPRGVRGHRSPRARDASYTPPHQPVPADSAAD